jgi:hypothetical protein
MMADIHAGRFLAKTPLVGKSLFRIKEQVPWGKNLYKEIERSSALGPLIKARELGAPIIIGVGLEKGLTKLKYKESSPMNTQQELHEKVASKMLQLNDENKKHKKKEHALKLLYKQAELGYAPFPQTYNELEEKLAELITQEDLVVLEKALNLGIGSIKIGELDRYTPSLESLDANERFTAALLGE